MTDFLLIGAGISGLLLTRELLAAGASVCIVDRVQSGQEASWAGGGIVSPLYPWRYADAVTALANYAQDAYPALAAALQAETGIDPELRQTGLLMLDAGDHDDALEWATRYQRSMQCWPSTQFYQREPELNAGFQQALWMPYVSNIRNPRLLKALKASVLLHKRCTLLEHAEVCAFDISDGCVRAVTINQGGVRRNLQAAEIVVTAGAWTGRLLEQAGLPGLPVQPVKGEMLLYQPGRPLLTSIVLSKGRYLIPRADGLILAGSTLEYSGFDKTASDHARSSLHASACNILPVLADVPILSQWAGLRPGAPAGVPFIGRMPGIINLSVNAGHFRNGLVLAPAAARLMSDLLLGRAPVIDPLPYDPASPRPADPGFL